MRRVVVERSGWLMYVVYGSGVYERVLYLCFFVYFCLC